MDAGPVWAAETFSMREATKSSLYRREATECAVRALLAAVRRFGEGGQPLASDPTCRRGRLGRQRPLMQQTERRIDWQRDDTQTVLRKIHAADGAPGVLDELFGTPCHLFDAHAEALPQRAAPGLVIGRRHEAVLRATVDGAVWVGHVRRADRADVLHFPFYNGAVSTARCERLTAAAKLALAQPPRVLVLLGGADFWRNGIHLNVIETAESPADESWRNINAIDDLSRTLIEETDRLVIAAIQGNAGAGGVFMALAADRVWARSAVVLNPHYKNMGNLYGSEYWTYLLPRRPLTVSPAEVMGHRLPASARQAVDMGLIDATIDGTPPEFVARVLARAQALAADAGLPAVPHAKRQRRLADEAHKPLAAYREEELARMRRNFYGFDPSYHIARSNFVRRAAPSWTPRHLAIHRLAGPVARSPAETAIDKDQGSGDPGSRESRRT